LRTTEEELEDARRQVEEDRGRRTQDNRTIYRSVSRPRSTSRPRPTSRPRSLSPEAYARRPLANENRRYRTSSERLRPSRVRVSEQPSEARTFPSHSGTHRSIKVPGAPEFSNDAQGKVKFSHWLVNMRMKLESGEFEGKTEGVKLRYILSRTDQSVFERLQVRIPSTAVTNLNDALVFKTADECFDQLSDWYGDRHRATRAWTELSNLKQGPRESFADFFAKYEEKMSYVALPEAAQIQQILDKLNARYGSKMNDGYHVECLKDFIRRCYALDAGFTRVDAYSKSDNPRRPDTPAAGSGTGNRPRGSDKPPKPRANNTRPESFLKLSAAERQKFRDKGQCFECHSTEHIFARCPERKNKTTNLAATAAELPGDKPTGTVTESENE